MGKQRELIFLFPNHENGNLDYQLGASYIIACLKQHHIHSEQLINRSFMRLADVLDPLINKKPQAIGFTCYDTNYFLVKRMAHKIKELMPKVIILAGGPTATFSDATILKDCPDLDICVRGEGELTTCEILGRIRSGENCRDILGTTLRMGTRLIRNPDRPFFQDRANGIGTLDTLPSPYLSGVLKPFDMVTQQIDIPVVTSRGCTYRCTYCNSSAISKHTVRYHSADRIVSELAIIKKGLRGNPHPIAIHDDTFTLNRKRATEICRRLIKAKLNLTLWLRTRPDLVDKELLELLYHAGVREINFGMESASPRLLYNIHRVRTGITPDNDFAAEKTYLRKIRENVKLAKTIGIRITLGAIFGLPGETFRDGLKNLNFIRRIAPHDYRHYHLIVYPGTKLYEEYRKTKSHLCRRNRLSFPAAYRYDLTRLPQLKCSFQLKKSNYENKIYTFLMTRALIGLYPNEFERCTAPQDIILEDEKTAPAWLSRHVALQTRIIVLEGASRFSRFTDNDHRSRSRAVISLRNYVSHISRRAKSTPVGFKSKGTAIRKTIRLDLAYSQNIPDLAMKTELAGKTKPLFFNRKNSLSCDIVTDCCRWDTHCPALDCKRLIINRNGQILPCFNAKPIGNTAETLEVIRGRFKNLTEKTFKSRGCLRCVARDHCSRCLFLGNITEQSYCATKIKHYHSLLKQLADISLCNLLDMIKTK
ncbi:MAG: radical SAM protein [Candidatus Omnitrophica bacterium]|nr:radical SAM protein [Candidatus Omnitrophota bacterium]